MARVLMPALGIAIVVSACTQTPATKSPDTADTPSFRDVPFSALPGWASDRHAAAIPALIRSCPPMEKRGVKGFGSAAVWQSICVEARTLPPGDDRAARAFFERRFAPAAVSGRDGRDGLITGYFEPELQGTRKRQARFDVPLHVRPPDLVAVDLGRFSKELKGKRIAGRVVQGRLIPYHNRGQIEGGALRGKKLELVWVDDAADAFFLHIQGSGRIRLRDGSVLRVGYAGTNGQAYTAIGRELIARGEIPRERMSMQAIRKWMGANPLAGAKLMRTNKSYVFFRELTGPGPIGAQGVALTPERSIAIDRGILPLGLPVWMDTVLPDAAVTPYRRLMVAQDTGGAIKGAVRADVFWGPGTRAAQMAGSMKSPGRYWFLRPRSAATGS
ncbi:MAG: membrane-bound lytic murein transglycosylase A [Paracoccaceae bacterium]